MSSLYLIERILPATHKCVPESLRSEAQSLALQEINRLSGDTLSVEDADKLVKLAWDSGNADLLNAIFPLIEHAVSHQNRRISSTLKPARKLMDMTWETNDPLNAHLWWLCSGPHNIVGAMQFALRQDAKHISSAVASICQCDLFWDDITDVAVFTLLKIRANLDAPLSSKALEAFDARLRTLSSTNVVIKHILDTPKSQRGWHHLGLALVLLDRDQMGLVISQCPINAAPRTGHGLLSVLADFPSKDDVQGKTAQQAGHLIQKSLVRAGHLWAATDSFKPFGKKMKQRRKKDWSREINSPQAQEKRRFRAEKKAQNG